MVGVADGRETVGSLGRSRLDHSGQPVIESRVTHIRGTALREGETP